MNELYILGPTVGELERRATPISSASSALSSSIHSSESEPV